MYHFDSFCIIHTQGHGIQQHPLPSGVANMAQTTTGPLTLWLQKCAMRCGISAALHRCVFKPNFTDFSDFVNARRFGTDFPQVHPTLSRDVGLGHRRSISRKGVMVDVAEGFFAFVLTHGFPGGPDLVACTVAP